jgi:hypothetical protein
MVLFVVLGRNRFDAQVALEMDLMRSRRSTSESYYHHADTLR